MERNAPGRFPRRDHGPARLRRLSGGWAWHFMTPAPHVELKQARDHKDVDVFVAPANVSDELSKIRKRVKIF